MLAGPRWPCAVGLTPWANKLIVRRLLRQAETMPGYLGPLVQVLGAPRGFDCYRLTRQEILVSPGLQDGTTARVLA